MNSSASFRAAVCALALLPLTACVSGPRVYYHTDLAKDRDGLTKFSPAKTLVMVTYEEPKPAAGGLPAGAAAPKARYSMTAVPAEVEGTVYAVRPVKGWFHETHLKVTKRANTNLIESIGTEFEDKRIQIIEKAGGAIAALAGMSTADAGPDSDFPYALDTAELLEKCPADGTRCDIKPQQIGTGSFSFAASIAAVPADAIPTAEFLASLKKGDKLQEQAVFFYSACRSMQLSINQGQDRLALATLTIADPRFVQTIELPAKGAVEMHSSCGVNVKGEKSGTASGSDIVNALIAQAKSIKDAHAGKDKAK